VTLGSDYLGAVERWTMILAAAVIAAAVVAAPRPIAFAATVGAGLMVANAWAMRRIGRKVALSADRPGAAILLLNVKLLVLIAVVYLAIRVFGLDTLGFLVGVSVLPAALLVAALRTAPTDDTHLEEERRPNG
jgi:hypothetical protein